MADDQPRRPRRNPLTAEEVAEIVALKKRQAHFRLEKFKRSRFYRILNVANLCICFLYMEMLFCFLATCRYERHRATFVTANFGQEYRMDGQAVVNDLDVVSTEGEKYRFIVKEFIEVPGQNAEFYVGSDFLLRKELKGFFENEDHTYRIFAASPILFLCSLVLVANLLGFVYNLNQYAYSLTAISVLNGLTLFAIACY